MSIPAARRLASLAAIAAQARTALDLYVRRIVREKNPGFEANFGTPVSQLDMVFTTMTFSVHVIDGLAALGVALSHVPPFLLTGLFSGIMDSPFLVILMGIGALAMLLTLPLAIAHWPATPVSLPAWGSAVAVGVRVSTRSFCQAVRKSAR